MNITLEQAEQAVIAAKAKAIELGTKMNISVVDAGANNLAGDDFNRGIRAYYFGLAASAWLLNPAALGLLAIAVLVVLYRRDYHSAALDILRQKV